MLRFYLCSITHFCRTIQVATFELLQSFPQHSCTCELAQLILQVFILYSPIDFNRTSEHRVFSGAVYMHRSRSSASSVNRNKYMVKNNSCRIHWGYSSWEMKIYSLKRRKQDFFFFYEVWRLAGIKHKYIILYMYLYKHIIFCLSKTV